MKKFKIIGVTLMAVVALCVCFACGSDSSGDSSLVGTWVMQTTSSHSETITFKANGTGTSYYTSGTYKDSEDFKWKTSGNRLYITFMEDDSYSGDEEETEIFIYTIEDDILTLTDDDSYSGKHTAIYKRQK